MIEILKAFIHTLGQLFSKPTVKTPTQSSSNPQPLPVVVPPVIVTPPPKPIETTVPPSPTSSGFLICPIQANDKNGKPVTSRTVKIVSVVDHSDTAIDPASKKGWGKNAKDQKAKAFNGEVGDSEPSSSAPFGYTKKVPSPFFTGGEINYVGASDPNDKYPGTYYLNYDGHAGYDFGYSKMTPILACADGLLHKATNPEDTVYGQGWGVHHTFYVKHANGFSTWYRHCEKLSDEIEAQIGLDYTKSCPVKQGQTIAYLGNFGAVGAHLHLEVKNSSGKIVDPYGDNLWKDYL